MSKKVLIVEDQFIEANNLQMILERANYRVCGIARSVDIALKLLGKDTPDLVLLDIFLQGDKTGIDLAKFLQAKKIAFIYLSANSNRETLEAAKATQPYGFLVKPFRAKDVLVMLEIADYAHQTRVDHHNGTSSSKENNSRAVTGTIKDDFNGIIGGSQEIKSVIHQLKIVAPSDTSVLILGESGTGKERVAECIHECSPRRNAALVKVNCAAIPATLIESILFGHERGSFTGATEKRIGKFEQAHGGTIFLDEIGEMSHDLQLRLLRVLQEKEIERLGGNKPIPIDVRVIAATNRDLNLEVAEGRFRLDLYYRLHVFPIQLPALRERPGDIPLLARHFLALYAGKLGKPISDISDSALQQLVQHHWPGNVRELQHVIERAVLLEQNEVLSQVPVPMTGNTPSAMLQKIKTMEENERDHIIEVLQKCGGKISGKGGAADMLKMNVSTLNSRIKKLGILKRLNIGP